MNFVLTCFCSHIKILKYINTNIYANVKSYDMMPMMIQVWVKFHSECSTELFVLEKMYQFENSLLGYYFNIKILMKFKSK